MIASYRHSFIFLKTPKTAGTSIELALSPHCGPEDILSPFGMEWEFMRASMGVLPRNYSHNKALEGSVAKAIEARNPGALRQLLAESRKTDKWGARLGSHASAEKVKAWVGDQFWEGTLKFTVIRHPYETTLSFANFTYVRQNKERAFADHIDAVLERFGSFFVPSGVICVDGKLAVDVVIQYDDLEEGLRGICGKVGFAVNRAVASCAGHRRRNTRQGAHRP